MNGAEPAPLDATAPAVAEEPGLQPAPQTEHAALVDAPTRRGWPRRHLARGA